MDVNPQLNAYRLARSPKFHEMEMLNLIAKRHPDFRGRCLDVGCASGVFIELMLGRFPNATFIGFDAAADLLQLARTRLHGTACELVVGDALTYVPQAPCDIIVASGVLSVFEDFREPLQAWLSWLAPGGSLYIFGRFNSRDIDTIVRFRNNTVRGGWQGGLTSYSVHTIGHHLTSQGYPYEFIRFRLPVALAESDDPIRTYTRETVDGERLVLNGANTVAEHYFLIVDTSAKRLGQANSSKNILPLTK